MKKTALTAAVLVALSAGAAIAGMTPGTGIVGSPHDMNNINGLTDDSMGRVCAFCHTPHHALQLASGEQTPLWSHDFTTQSYKPYQSPTLDADNSDTLVGPSRLCMSCHDGVIAADQHYGVAASGTNGRLSSDAWGNVAVGKASATSGGQGDLSNDHPVGFDYEAVASVDAGIFSSANDRLFIGNTVKIADTLAGGFMTCATCHDVHNKDNVATPNSAGNYFLYASQAGSALCLSCHAKGEEVKP